ncbi:hypothetical protein THII_1484 [Thioploca ingrica]|uniref:Transmembrane protein n=1 Tax=Thioploca ingrica TaxID=40754 RepID=A0A090BUV8_9GAMM|nr:hypothetical protein THII_1484 [Thioploca ingrica]
MGIFLGIGGLAGCVIGLIITVILSRIGLYITTEMAKKQDWVWWYFTVVFVVTLPTLVFVGNDIISYSYVAKPGQDYDIAMKIFFLKGLGLCACPGLAAFFAAFLTAFIALLLPKKSINNQQS